MLFMDGFKNGQGVGKKLLSLQVIRVKNGEPATLLSEEIANADY